MKSIFSLERKKWDENFDDYEVLGVIEDHMLLVKERVNKKDKANKREQVLLSISSLFLLLQASINECCLYDYAFVDLEEGDLHSS